MLEKIASRVLFISCVVFCLKTHASNEYRDYLEYNAAKSAQNQLMNIEVDLNNLNIYNGLTDDRDIIDKSLIALDYQSHVYLDKRFHYSKLRNDYENFGLIDGIVKPLMSVWIMEVGNKKTDFGEVILPVLAMLNPSYNRSISKDVEENFRKLDPRLQSYIESVGFELEGYESLKFKKLREELRVRQQQRRAKRMKNSRHNFGLRKTPVNTGRIDRSQRDFRARNHCHRDCISSAFSSALSKTGQVLVGKTIWGLFAASSNPISLTSAGAAVGVSIVAFTGIDSNKCIKNECSGDSIKNNYPAYFEDKADNKRTSLKDGEQRQVDQGQESDSSEAADTTFNEGIESDNKEAGSDEEKIVDKEENESEAPVEEDEVKSMGKMGFNIDWYIPYSELREDQLLELCDKHPEACDYIQNLKQDRAGEDEYNKYQKIVNEYQNQNIRNLTFKALQDQSDDEQKYGFTAGGVRLVHDKKQIEDEMLYNHQKRIDQAKFSKLGNDCFLRKMNCNEFYQLNNSFSLKYKNINN